jgi:sterol desaturase/sphingolipid hydroxylase (fatty acid hydroxylase superfamily)
MLSYSNLLVDIFRLCLWLAILAAIFIPLEQLVSLERRPVLRPRLAEDVGFYFLSSLLPAFLLGLPMAALVTAVHHVIPPGYFAWLNRLPLWLQLGATLVIGEFGFYWGHRWSHQSPFLWRFHAVHHRPEGLDWLINTRAHPVDLVFGKLCGLVPIYLLGLAGRGAGAGNLPALLLVICGTIWGFFIHSNIRCRLGRLEHVIASPHFHHWHHTRGRPIDRNFASMLPLMDRMFGTFHHPDEWPASYGVAIPHHPVHDTVRSSGSADPQSATA